MNYGKKPSGFGKGFGKGLGGGGYRSGYLAAKDPLAAYRQSSAPVDDYTRKLRHRLEKPEVSMSGNFSSDTSNYKPNFTKQFTETKLSQKQVDELSEKFLENAIEEFKKITNTAEVPQEKYEVMQNTADEIAQKFVEVKNNPEDETTVLDFTKESLENNFLSNSDILERVEEIRGQLEQMKSETLEIRDSLPEFEKFVDDMNKADDLFTATPQETQPQSEIPDLYEPLEQTRKKKNEWGYESEFDAI